MKLTSFINLLLLVIYLPFQTLVASVTVSKIENDPPYSQLLTELASDNNFLTGDQLNRVCNITLNYVLPIISERNDYQQRFMMNCSILFLPTFWNATCNVDLGYTEKKITSADPGYLVLRNNLQHMPRFNLLVINYYVVLSEGKYLYGEGNVHHKRPRKLTETVEQLPPVTITPTVSEVESDP